MTDCISIQGSTSSSSDVMTLTTAASSWCAMPTNSRIRVLRLVRPHQTRRMLMVTGPESNPSYGFAVRGGKEFGTGFFVSQVERNSEADLKGLRIGDQILRLNGFRVEDAVHKEFIRFVSSQDRITLKVRGVGMLPIKEESERLSWNVVKMPSISNTPSESSFKTVTTEHSSTCSAIGSVGDSRCKDISIILDVAPRTKLGLGICKGPEWKPGIFVQFTKEKSVAREAGLRPGDQILSVNSIDFSDVLFSEAVAVMKSSNKLEMIVRTAAGCDLFPGESSGYNSSASSVTGDQSPCWADAKSKRLTAVHEEPTIAACWNDALYAEHQNRDSNRNTTTPKEVNKTIIKLSENGTSINNTYVANPHLSSRLSGSQKMSGNSGHNENTLTKSTSNVMPSTAPHSTMCLYSNVEQPGRSRHLQQTLDAARSNGNVNSNIHRSQQYGEEKYIQRNGAKMTSAASAAASAAASTVTSVKTVCPPKAPPPALYSNLVSKGSNNQNTGKSSNINEMGAPGSTLSSAITEELKKRREKQRFSNNTNNADNIANNNNNNNNKDNNNCSINNNNSSNNKTENQQKKAPTIQAMMTASTVAMQRHQQHQHNQHYHHHQHNQQQHQQHHQEHQQQTIIASPTKRAPSVRVLSSNSANCNERNSNICSNANGTVNSSTIDQHSALMDEFKRAHQRMFKNGFHENERKERQEALKRTSIMEDDSSHRTSRQFPNDKSSINDAAEVQQPVNQQNVPPPPPQFANSPPKNQSNNTFGLHYQTIKRATPAAASIAKQSNLTASKPPNSPIPDYDNVDFHKRRQQQQQQQLQQQMNDTNVSNNKITATVGNTNGNRKSSRLGAVTIGEYEPQRKEPSKFQFVGNKNREVSNGYSNSRNIENLHSELHDTLSRSKLKNGHQIEHQRDCPLRNGNGIDQLTHKIQSVHLNEGTATVKRQSSSVTNGTGISTGILKNGNNRNSNSNGNGLNGHSTKMIEKTITFGN